jgi:REP element-mobilizing transposase RayT
MEDPVVASTYLSLHYHIVFSTKDRAPFIKEAWIGDLHSYLGGTVSGLGGVPQAIGGVADHVHLLVGLKATHCLADFLRELKKSATLWVHEIVGDLDFAWQEGYAAFTVGATNREPVRHYIGNQAEHHRVRPYREELIEMLRRAEIEFDERYLE